MKRLWIYLAAAIAAIVLLAGAYLWGRGDGAAIARDKQAAIERAVAAERAKREQLVDQLGGAAAARETERQTNTREIIRESHTTTERPVYRNVCIDADGVRLLDRAAAAANGEDSGVPAPGTDQAAPAPTQ